MSQVGGHLTIGELAKRARVSVQTLRFYERTGLLPDPGRGASGSREYGPEMVARVRFVRAAKEVGFSLDEIGELLSLRVRRGASCARVKQSAQAKVDAIDERMKRLRIVRRVLVRLVVACSGDRAVEDCAILGALERDLA